MEIDEDIVLIAGPTASGKTGLAIDIAKAGNGVIINADSMQVYDGLRIITARPSPDEEKQAVHHLFGYRDPAKPFSVAQWLSDVTPLLNRFLEEGRQMIFVGGTGMYFNALLYGLSPMPEIDPEIRGKWRNMNDEDAEMLHMKLSDMDPDSAQTIRPSDRQRILRALEVYESTGQSIVNWQKAECRPLIPAAASIHQILKMPERAVLHERINHRFDRMVESGAVEEVQLFLERDLDPGLSAMKAIGVPQLRAYLSGEMSLEEAVQKAKAATRQYAKRQSTWFRNSFGERWILHSGL